MTTSVITLRGLEIHGSNLTGINGVNLLGGGEVYIENCRIQNFNNDGVRLAPTANFVHQVTIRNCDIRNNVRGVEIIPTAPATVRLAAMESNFSGNTPGSGIDVAGANNRAAVYNSSMNSNVVGLLTQQATSNAYAENCLIAFNQTGVSANGEIRLSRNTIVENTTNGVTGATRGFGSNMIFGNAGNNTVTVSVASQ